MLKFTVTLGFWAVLLSLLGVILWQQRATRHEIAELQIVASANYADLVATRAVMDEMRVSMAGSVNDLHALQSSMELALGESILVYHKSAQAIAEIEYVVQYMRQWTWAHFPQE